MLSPGTHGDDSQHPQPTPWEGGRGDPRHGGDPPAIEAGSVSSIAGAAADER